MTTKTYNLGASAAWEIDIFGKVTNAKRGARAALESSRAYEQAVQTRLVATVANSYYTLLMLDRQLAVNERTLATWEKSVKVLEVLKQAGKSNDAAVLQARANRMALESSVLALRRSIHETENALSVLLAMPPAAIERGTLNGQRFPEEMSVGVPLQLLANRPDVRQAEYNLAQAFYAVNAARAAFYPSLTLSGSLGWTNNGGAVTNPAAWLARAAAVQSQREPRQPENRQSTSGGGNPAVPAVAARCGQGGEQCADGMADGTAAGRYRRQSDNGLAGGRAKNGTADAPLADELSGGADGATVAARRRTGRSTSPFRRDTGRHRPLPCAGRRNVIADTQTDK